MLQILAQLADLGVLRCYVAGTGELVYEKRLPSAFQSSPIAANGKLYLASLDGDVFVVKAGPEFEILARNPMSDTCQATPAITGNMLLVRTRTALFAIEAAASSESASKPLQN